MKNVSSNRDVFFVAPLPPKGGGSGLENGRWKLEARSFKCGTEN